MDQDLYSLSEEEVKKLNICGSLQKQCKILIKIETEGGVFTDDQIDGLYRVKINFEHTATLNEFPNVL